MNSTTNSPLIFQKPTSATISSHPTQSKIFLKTSIIYLFFSLAIRTTTPSNFQFVTATANSNVRPIILHQKGPSTGPNQPQLLTVMPAGVRVQQLTPVIRASSNQPATIVRLMSPVTSTVRPGLGQQQIIQLNTTKQQQPLVIKAITASTANRQQPILLTTNNTQTKTILPQTQQQQQVLVLNQGGQQSTQQKFTLQVTNSDNGQQESTTNNSIPQLDGAVDDQVNIFFL